MRLRAGMSPPGRPKGESSLGEEVAQRLEGRPFSPPGRPKGESSLGEEVAQRLEGRRFSPPGFRQSMMIPALALALGVSALPPAVAQGQGAVARVEIPAQPLSRALLQLGDQMSLQMLFSQDTVRGLMAPAVQGDMSADEALSRLLEGSGVEFTRRGDSVSLRRAPGAAVSQLAPVQVSSANPGELSPAYAGGLVATAGRVGMLGNRDFMETPFSTISYTEQAIQQAQDLAQVITATDPGVYNSGTRGTVREAFIFRGFDVGSGDIAYGGLYGLLPYNRVPLELIERVEVLKGPSAMLNGMPPGGSIGGSVNLVPKRAGETPLTRVTGLYVSDGQYGTHVDVGRRFGTEQQVGVRVNGVYQNGDTSIDGQSKRVALGALGVDWRHERIRLSADLHVNKDQVNGVNRGIDLAPGVARPEPTDPRQSLMPDWTYSTSKDKAVVVRGEVDVTSDVMAYFNYGHSQTDFDGLLGTRFTVMNDAGDYRTNFGQQSQAIERDSADVGLMARFSTAGVKHELAMNASYYRQEIESATAAFLLPADWYTNINDPQWGSAPDTVLNPSDLPRTSASRLTSFGIADTLSFAGDRVLVTLGVRRQKVVSDAYHPVSGARTSRYDASATTPALAVLVKLGPEVSLYGNYIQGLSQGAVAPVGTVNAGEVFAPYKSKQHEVGIKTDWTVFSTTLSLFQIERPSSYIDPATNVFSFGGEQRNRGAELGFFGEPLEGLRLMGGVAYTQAKLIRTAGGVDEGRYAMAQPRWQGKLGVEWDVPRLAGLTLTGNVLSVSGQYYSRDNSQQTAGRTTFDLGARYQTTVSGTPLTLRATVQNVTNKAYWAAGGAGKLWLGAPRTFLLSASAEF